MKYKTRVFEKTITTAGTAERITEADISSPWVMIQLQDGANDLVYIGDDQVDKTGKNGICLKETNFAAADSLQNQLVISVQDPSMISLRDIWVDMVNAADVITVMYLERIE